MARHLELHTRVSSSPRSSRPSPTTSRYELGGLGSAFGEGIGLGLGRSLSTRSTSSQTQSQTQTQAHSHSPRLPVQQDDYFTRNTLVPAPAHTYTHTHIHTHTHTYTHSHTHANANAAGQSPHLAPVAAPDADRLAWHRMRFMTLDDSPLASPGSPPLAGTSGLGLGSPALGSPALESPMFGHPAHSPSPISPVSPTDEYRAQFGRACMRASMRTSILGPPLKSRSMDVPPDGTGRSAARHLRLSVEPRRIPRTPRGSNESSGRDEETTDSGCSAGEEDGLPPAPVGDGLVTPIREHLLPIERTRSPCPAIVSTPPETPRRLTAVPSTPPRSASSRQQYHLPRSPGTPHLGAEIARIQGSPMTRSPGCRSLSSFI